MDSIIFENVILGKGAILEEGVVIGRPPHGKRDGELPTVIGENAVIRAYTIICAGVTIGNNFQTGPHVFIREQNTIGDNVCVWANAVINYDNQIGNDVRLHVGSFIEKTKIGNHVFFGPHAVCTDDPHPVMPPDYSECWRGASIGDGAIIGANSTILPHVSIGNGAVIGAGSVVTKPVPEFTVAVGNPAKVIKFVEDIVCTRCGQKHKPYEHYRSAYANDPIR